MALIECPDCKAKASSTAEACPQCGCSFETKMDWTTASLAAAMLLLVTQLLCVDTMTEELNVSLYFATVSLPLLLASYGVPGRRDDARHALLYGILTAAALLGVVAGFASLAAMFFFFAPSVGWLFLAVSAVTLVLNRAYVRAARRRIMTKDQ
jgi:hypothetical protein